ncbi:M16 family metallopeptidase [Paracidobacterium acidisoli]|uniref:Insulinase family protein n=1 Tax=Paracidobacterium acidisoli TaxID=2303751 RepID=A0A372IP53_9BACT|nr:pitrilysin family protein [Paracidobacterium acidisoli]MBT9330981.1 insulinase family protein [Paracidobacterium acidisoli]
MKFPIRKSPSPAQWLLILCILALLAPLSGFAQYQAGLEKRVTVKKLPNGLTLLICERPEAPVFSYFTIVDAGDANDPGGESGLAHMFEHLAFKGTKDIGTTDYAGEKIALDKLEDAWTAYDAEYRKRVQQDQQKLKELKAQFDAAEQAANKFVIPNEFTQIAEANGATGLNAETSLDATQYFWSMPSNRLELWAYLESDRIANPVPRQFYRERNVVQEERRMRVDSSPIGRLVEQFLAVAYIAHPYRRPGVGWESEISQVNATEAMAFHRKYYVPSNIVIAVVGDVDTTQALPVLEKYFGAIPSGPSPEPITTIEPPQTAERQVIIKDASQPLYLEGYHRPDYRDPDDAVYEAIQDIFSNGRTSRLYRSLVRDQQIAAEAEGFSGFPGEKYPGLFAFFVVPNPGHTPAEMRAALHKEINRLKTTDVTDDELAMFKTRARADILRSLGDNQGLAEELAINQLRYGDWRELFNQLKQIDAVTKEDIRRVANKTFTDTNRTWAEVDYNAPSQAEARPAAAPAGGAK